MPDIRCPNCGKNNPDFLDYCQFCQTPLKPESMLHMGEKPIKKNTGELENILPDWLRDVRQQAKDSAEQESDQSVFSAKVQKEEPPDLLAGLAYQAQSSDQEDVPDWLKSLSSPAEEEKPASQPAAAPETDFFAQFNQSQPAPEQTSAAPLKQPQTQAERDELSEWFTQAAEQPAEPQPTEPEDLDVGWDIPASAASTSEPSAPREQEDLSWLHNLEAESKRTGELPSSQQGEDWFAEGSQSAQSAGQEDLSWLNNLGALPASDEPAQPSFGSSQDLGWLNDLGGTPLPEQPAPASSAPREDLSWLNAFPEGPTSEPASSPPKPQEDLSWLNEFKDTSQPAAPFEQNASAPDQPAAQDDLSWLQNLQGSSDSLSTAPFTDAGPNQDQERSAAEAEPPQYIPPFTPRRTAPLTPAEDTSVPDWLKSATEAPSMPTSPSELDQFREDFNIPTAPEQPFSWKSFVPQARMDEEETPSQSGPFLPEGESPALSNQDVDSLFSVDMPDWLSQPPETPVPEKPVEDIGIHAEGGEALAPADLPSWVQAMRPVEAVISDAAVVEDQPVEREGPLAGFRGVIPVAPIGSARRPQAIPLKLQVSEEEQTGATIMEQILASETSPRPLAAAPTFVSQRALRQSLAVLIWLVLGAVVFFRTQILPVSPNLPVDVQAVSQTLELVPDSSSVLVVMDYDPSLAGEMEASSSPVLNHLVLLRHPSLSFLSTSPNGPGLVERLLRNTNISQPSGLAYRPNENYFNLGYLPGGDAGVLALVQSPATILPAMSAKMPAAFSGYSAVILLTDHADSARSWVEQLSAAKQADPGIANQPLLVVSSAQAAPMLQPYVGSRQVNGMVSGLADAARYESRNSLPGMARSYWDAFGVGIMMAIGLIVLGSLWSLFMRLRASRAETGEA